MLFFRLQSSDVQYCVKVKTSNLWNAETVATVTVLLLGQFGDSGPRSLWCKKSTKHRPFQQGQVSLVYFFLNHQTLPTFRGCYEII